MFQLGPYEYSAKEALKARLKSYLNSASDGPITNLVAIEKLQYLLPFQERCSAAFHKKLAAGASLFPPGVPSEVAIAIRTSTPISRRVVSQVLTTIGRDADEHARELEGSMGYLAEHFGVGVLDREPIQLSVEQLWAADNQVSEMHAFFNDCC